MVPLAGLACGCAFLQRRLPQASRERATDQGGLWRAPSTPSHGALMMIVTQRHGRDHAGAAPGREAL